MKTAILSAFLLIVGAGLLSAQTNAVATQRYVLWKIEERATNTTLTVNGQTISFSTNNVITVSGGGGISGPYVMAVQTNGVTKLFNITP